MDFCIMGIMVCALCLWWKCHWCQFPSRKGLVCLLDHLLYLPDPLLNSANAVLDLEREAGRTIFAAESDSQNAFSTLFEGSQWMIFRNVLTGVLHWDFVSLFLSWMFSDWFFCQTSLFSEDLSVFLSLIHSTPLYFYPFEYTHIHIQLKSNWEHKN